MVFSSLVFISVFLPVVFILYTVIPGRKLKNVLLIIASLLFYAYGEPVYVLVMICSVIFNYIFGLFSTDKNKYNKIVLIIAIIFNLGALAVFKYLGFFVSSLNDIIGFSIPIPNIELPIDISFFTFQALSYVIDVYRGEVSPQKNLGKVMLYISFFPQLIAGPIIKYHDIEKQIDNRQQTIDLVVNGFRRFIVGLSKKVLIANTMATVVDSIYSTNQSEVNILTAWVGAIGYTMQIYFDFSGYSDMAIGLGKMFGFEFKENFNYPYISTSVKEFWRRWHISLSTWFKEYLYIPLGGNRKGKGRTCLNKIIVFFCTGLWHGANWTFVIWGLYHGIFLLIESYIPKIKIPKFIKHIYLLLVVTIGFVIFRADDISQGIFMIEKMFTGFEFSSTSMSLFVGQMTPLFITTLLVAIIASLPFKNFVNSIVSKNEKTMKVYNSALYVLSFGLLALCMLNLSSGSYNPFIYFRF
ncbi:MAG: MBOAT family protein [Ruminococcus sp.]|nr:MBOAT family protein [Ruminococcus sp.]MDD6709302.1 MBOAT family protein [Ruminococcus sp.]